MVTTYILVICLSAWLIAFGMALVARRFVAVLGPKAVISPALCILLPMLSFLAVVAAPPAVLMAALVLLLYALVVGVRTVAVGVRVAVPVMAAALAATNVTMPALANVPAAAMMGVAFLWLAATGVVSLRAPDQASGLTRGYLLALLPLIAAPLMGAPSFIALDVAIIASCLLAGAMALPPYSPMAAARAPLGLILGWLILAAALGGAWLPALVSALAYAGSIAYGSTRFTHSPGFDAR
jgi:hypothetical protein